MKHAIFIFSFFIVLLTGCNTLKQPKTVEVALDYNNTDIKNLEIERIKKLRDTEPVEALWRSLLLNNSTVIEDSKERVLFLYNQAIENGDYFEAVRLYKSLISIGYNFPESAEAGLDELYFKDIPGFEYDEDKAVHSIADSMNATVTIWVDKGLKLQNGAGYQDIVIGSGFFIDKRGYIVTNHHVIEAMVDSKYEGYSRLYIKLLSDVDTKIPAKVIGYDPLLDLALLKVEIEPEFVLKLGSSKALNIGDKISAIGTPIGLEGTLTSGIISSVNRKLLTLGNVFQLDAAVNSGNSGGPLIDENLTVQAIVFAGVPQFQGLNFAIPVEYLKQELAVLYSGREFVHSWIGAYGHTKRSGNKKTGLEVQYIMPGGSGFVSGLREGDVITELDGNLISTIEDFQIQMMGYQCGTLLKCKYFNSENEEKSTFLYLEKRPEFPLKEIYNRDFVTENFIPIFGMKLVHSSTTSNKSYRIEKIIKGSVADEMSFSENDTVIVKNVTFDNDNEVFYAQIGTHRRKKDIFDITITMGSSYDNPYYF